VTGRLGEVAQWAAVVALAVAAASSWRGRDGAARVLHRAGAAAAAVAVGCLGWALATGDFTLSYVAATSDRASSWPYRLAGLWGGMAGSLLLWAAMVAAWGARRRSAAVERAALAGLAAAVLAVGAVLASPWHRLASPALDGEGLTPILEHPAMLIHPPLLYAGLTGLAVPYAAVLGCVPWDRVRRQLLVCVAAVTAGMAIGAHWAYAEVGWGGFWAWDPVENTALLPWLAAVAALHLVRAGRHAPAAAATCGALVLALLGTVLTRSGATESVHAFAEDPDVGWALGAVALATVVATPLATRTASRDSRGARAASPGPALAASAAAGVVLLVVLVGTVRPLVGDAAVAVEGTFYARLVGPVAVAAAVVLVATGAWRRGAAVAHVGYLVLLVGVLGSTGGASTTATVATGASIEVGGWEVRNDGVRIVDDRTVAVDISLVRGGDERARLEPSLVAHPERGGLLAETSLRSTPLTDVLVALRDAGDDGRALLEVHVRPLVWWVWWGAALVAAGLLLQRRRGPRYETAPSAAAQSEASSVRSPSPTAA
jgi:cytochrome c biogenesis factor